MRTESHERAVVARISASRRASRYRGGEHDGATGMPRWTTVSASQPRPRRPAAPRMCRGAPGGGEGDEDENDGAGDRAHEEAAALPRHASDSGTSVCSSCVAIRSLYSSMKSVPFEAEELGVRAEEAPVYASPGMSAQSLLLERRDVPDAQMEALLDVVE